MTLTYDDIILSLQSAFLNDPMYKAFNEGRMSWYDICLQYNPDFYTPKVTYGKPKVVEKAIEKTVYNSNIMEKDDDNMEVIEEESDSDSDSYLNTFARIITSTNKKDVQSAPIKAKKATEIVGDWDIAKPAVNDNGIATLVARNLPRDITRDELRIVFEKYGPIRDIHIPINADKSSQYYGTIRGFAMIEFLSSKDSASAYNGEYGTLTIRGKNINVDFTKGDRKNPDEMATSTNKVFSYTRDKVEKPIYNKNHLFNKVEHVKEEQPNYVKYEKRNRDSDDTPRGSRNPLYEGF
jgi:RNA recognition motif-containing protein